MAARQWYGLVVVVALLAYSCCSSIVAAQNNVPPDWVGGVKNANILFAAEEPTDPSRMAYVGNGYVATVVGTDTQYAVGVFNGFNSSSTRARIPATTAISVTNTWPIGSALDLESGVFYRRSQFQQCLACAVVQVEQRWYAHRVLPSLLVHEIHVNVTSRPASTNEVVQLSLTLATGPDSKDIDFSTVSSPIPGVTVWKGSVRAAEESTIQPQQVAVCFSNVPSSLSIKVNGSFPQTFTYLTAIRTSLDSSDIVNAACQDWKNGTELTKQRPPNDLFHLHVFEWLQIWRAGIEIGGRLELARAVNSSLYYLLSSIRPVQTNKDFPIGAYSLSPGSLSTDGYNGHSFWDAETWMYPTLLLLHPQLAANVIDYRFTRLQPALDKAQAYGYKGSMFPWESAFTGFEVCPWPPGSQREQHITGDIGMAVQQYWRVNKDVSWLKSVGFPLISSIADFWASRVIWNSTRSSYGIDGVVGPDEYATGVKGSGINDNAYTNAIAANCLLFATEAALQAGKTPPPQWKDIASKMYYPFDNIRQYHPEYEDYTRGQIVKQADTIMLGYPLMLPMSPAVRKNDLEYYQTVTDPNGPAMTWGMFSLGYVELQQWNEAAKYFNQSYQYNINPPFFAWMETPNGGCNHFLTGAGGFLQGVWAGYGGLRINDDALTFTPRLTEYTDYIKYRQLNYLGSKVSVSYNRTHIDYLLEETGTQPLQVIDTHGAKHPLEAWRLLSLAIPSSIKSPFQLTRK